MELSNELRNKYRIMFQQMTIKKSKKGRRFTHKEFKGLTKQLRYYYKTTHPELVPLPIEIIEEQVSELQNTISELENQIKTYQSTIFELRRELDNKIPICPNDRDDSQDNK